MRKFRSPACPYCGKKVNPLLSWSLKKQGEYQCSKCRGTSNVILDPTVSLFGVSAIFLSVIFLLVFKFFVGEVNLLCVVLMILPFLIFNILALFLIRLKKPVFRKTVKAPQRRNPESPRPTEHHVPTNSPRENIEKNQYRSSIQRKL